jgi:5-methylcytosine-specific restriction enzyme subunit McrC
VITTTRSISLCEWETLSPLNCEQLNGFFPNASSGYLSTIKHLSDHNLLGVRELRHGLEIEAYSHVGKLSVGELSISIRPKISGDSLLRLIRYAYGFHRLHIVSDSKHLVDQWGFEDFLVGQLNLEIDEIIHRGLLRSYIPVGENLSSPRGRIDISKLVSGGGVLTAAIPCVHHPRITDTLLNRVLLAGLKYASTMASAIDLRRESRQLVSMMQEQISAIHLDATVLAHAMRQMNRLTVAYEPALKIIQLLMEAQGISLQGIKTSFQLPGFLFDMNDFFQTLLSRFLKESLEGYSVRDEFRLRNMFKYNRDFNPQHAQPPTPRADYVIEDRGEIKAILDAKYRDLWSNPLPREMLYQLVIYAISHSKNPQSTILYPCTDASAKEARIDISDVVFGNYLGQVRVRPVHIPRLLEVISDRTPRGCNQRREFAISLVFGD